MLHALLHLGMNDHRLAPRRDVAQGVNLLGSGKSAVYGTVEGIGPGGLPILQRFLCLVPILVQQVVGIVVPGAPITAAGVKNVVVDVGIFRFQHGFQRGGLHRLRSPGLHLSARPNRQIHHQAGGHRRHACQTTQAGGERVSLALTGLRRHIHEAAARRPRLLCFTGLCGGAVCLCPVTRLNRIAHCFTLPVSYHIEEKHICSCW